jgi:aerobic C4-dicarboxylate transport protein
VVSKWEGELDKERLAAELKNPSVDEGSLREEIMHETA